MWQAFLNIRDRVYQELRYLCNSYYSGKIDEHKNGPKQTWKILKQALGRGNKSAVIEEIIFNDQVSNEKQDIAEACDQYFASIGNKLTDQIQPSQDNPIWHIPVGKERFQFKQIKPAKVNTLLGKLKNGKATGIHNIPNKSLKLSKDIIASSLMVIFNASIEERILSMISKLKKFCQFSNLEEKIFQVIIGLLPFYPQLHVFLNE